MKNVKVIMHVQTRYNDKPLYKDNSVEVDIRTAERWAGKNPPFCTIVNEESIEEVTSEESVEEVTSEESVEEVTSEESVEEVEKQIEFPRKKRNRH